jgi:hypothetical protein
MILAEECVAVFETRNEYAMVLPHDVLERLRPHVGRQVSVLRTDGRFGDGFLVQPDREQALFGSHPEADKEDKQTGSGKREV